MIPTSGIAMHRFSRTPWVVAALAAGSIAVLPADADGQRRGPQRDELPTWAPISIGPHFGYDENANGEVLGVQMHVPVVRGGSLEIMPSANITFLNQLKEYQFNLDAVYVTGGRRGGIYLGGGLAWRNSIFGSDPTADRETIQGFGIVVGARSGVGGLFGSQLELRWIFLDESAFDPRLITFGVNFPLWGRSDRPGGGF